jgi:hypothetical protein
MKARLLIFAVALATILAPQTFAKHSTKTSKTSSTKKHQKKQHKKTAGLRITAPVLNSGEVS